MRAVLRANTVWMTANVVLAAVPFGLAVGLFARPRAKTWSWWVGVAAFVAFLPNAPYVLTDVVHLKANLQHAAGTLEVVGLLVQYGLLFGAGLAFYGGCLAVLRRRLLADGHPQWRWPAEI